MQSMMNGSLTAGTGVVLPIEMAEEAGEENLFLFGLKAEEVTGSNGWNTAGLLRYYNEAEIRAALHMISSDSLSRCRPGISAVICDALPAASDHPRHLPALAPYPEEDRRLKDLYARRDDRTRKTILNVAASGKSSSDRTIARYATDIREVEPCPIP